MATVWEKSQHSGTGLLMLLAIADFADDEGQAFPSVATLARKCRMKERNAQYILSELIESGELAILRGNGPRGCNLYKINIRSLGVQQSAPVQSTAPLQQSAHPPCNTVHLTPATECTQTIIETSVNHQGPLRGELQQSFMSFWNAYPRKAARADAQKAWKKLNPNPDLLVSIMAALKSQSQSADWQKDGGKFIPYPATWLNGRRWEDEVSTSPTAKNQANPFEGAL